MAEAELELKTIYVTLDYFVADDKIVSELKRLYTHEQQISVVIHQFNPIVIDYLGLSLTQRDLQNEKELSDRLRAQMLKLRNLYRAGSSYRAIHRIIHTFPKRVETTRELTIRRAIIEAREEVSEASDDSWKKWIFKLRYNGLEHPFNPFSRSVYTHLNKLTKNS